VQAKRNQTYLLGKFRHGLTAITIVDTLEAATEFKKFERKINADYSPRTAVEFAAVARLTSLLWRLRRATSIESGLLQNQGIDLNGSPGNHEAIRRSKFKELSGICSVVPPLGNEATPNGAQDSCRIDANSQHRENVQMADQAKIDIAGSFLKVSELNG
jgi:hypothetical protein